MLRSLRVSSLYVLDQDEAIDFYCGKLGLQVIDDIPLGYMRWLTVGLPDDGGRSILLEVPGAPAMDEKGAAEVRAQLTKGRTGGNLFFTTDDCQKTYEELVAKGVEIAEPPTDRGYGIDCGLRDPFGNYVRFSQMSESFTRGEWSGATV
ncbi:MAG TPA: VOC family protein [Candidatus Dormibacteraeota bacterium]